MPARGICSIHGKTRSLDHLQASNPGDPNATYTCTSETECRMPTAPTDGGASPSYNAQAGYSNPNVNSFGGQINGVPLLVLPYGLPDGTQNYVQMPLTFHLPIDQQVRNLYARASQYQQDIGGNFPQGVGQMGQQGQQTTQRQMCATHGKMRSAQSLSQDPNGNGYVCRQTDPCKIPRSSTEQS